MRKKSPTILLVVFCVFAFGAFAFYLSSGRVVSVSVDLTRPESIIWPCEISIVGDMGEEGLRISPNVGSGWEGDTGGKASYRFYIPEDGRYHIWAYALWFDKCTNAIYAEIDTQGKAIIGNDPICGQWHWVRGFAVRLKKGAHALTLSNHSDHVSLQKILLTNSGTARPDDCDLVFSDVFYDGFDGCHIGNFASWEPVAGEWDVLKPAPEARYVESALVGKSESEAIITYEAEDWSDYSFHVAVREMPSDDPNAAVGIQFGLNWDDDFHQLKWRPIAGTDTVQMELTRQQGEAVHVLTSFAAPWSLGTWHEVEVVLDKQTIKIMVDNQQQLETSVEESITGGIGLYLQGRSTAYFDDIHVRTVSEGLRDAD